MRFASVFAVVLMGIAPRAYAGDLRLAVVNLRIDLPESERAQARAALETAIQKLGIELVPDLHVQHQKDTRPELFSCFIEDRCRADIGMLVSADFLLTGSIERDSDAYVVVLDVFDVSLVTVGKRVETSCPQCSEAEFLRRLTNDVEKAVKTTRTLPRGILVVKTRPPGAEVKLDSRPVGVSDVELVVAAGMHTLELGGPGRSPISMPIEVKAKERHPVDIKMSVQEAPIPTPPQKTDKTVPPQPPPMTLERFWKPQRVAGLVLLGVGAAAAVSSIAPFVLDGSCSDSGCFYLRSTKAAGIGLAAAGAAVAVAGAILMATTPRRRIQATIVPAVTTNGAGLVGAIRF